MLYIFFSASNNWMKEKRFLCMWHHSIKLIQNEAKKRNEERKRETRQDGQKKYVDLKPSHSFDSIDSNCSICIFGYDDTHSILALSLFLIHFNFNSIIHRPLKRMNCEANMIIIVFWIDGIDVTIRSIGSIYANGIWSKFLLILDHN